MSKKIVSYIRVSTQRQGASGLGLEAQQAAVKRFCREHGAMLAAEFVEVESGTKKDRPQLRLPLAKAKSAKATLVFAKWDRLGRNLALVATLLESGVEFVACDNPHANRLTIHILAAVAEEEARTISARTKAALAAYKARGGRLGAANPKCRSLTRAAARKGATASGKRTSTLARQENAEAAAIARELQGQGLSLRAIAAELDERGVPTRHGGAWSHIQVGRILDYARA